MILCNCGARCDGSVPAAQCRVKRRYPVVLPGRVYIAGPMQSIPDYNFPAFRTAAADLRDQGYDVVSPAEMDESEGFDPTSSDGAALDETRLHELLSRDIKLIASASVRGLVVLPGWTDSGGARLEVHTARSLGKPVYEYPSLKVLFESRRADRPESCPDVERVPYGPRRKPEPLAAKEQTTCARQVASGGPNPCGWCWDCKAIGEPERSTNAGVPSSAEQDETRNANTIRTFATGATRDTDDGKPDYEGYLHPRGLRAYGRYMLRHSIQSDGSRRPSDNWQKGIPRDAYMSSAWRHFMDWWTIHRGHGAAESVECDAEEAICALLFNAMGYLSVLLAAEPTAEDCALSEGDFA